MEKQAVLIMAYGSPESLDDIEPYLLDVRGGRATPAELVEEIKGRYAAIGGKSPLLTIARAQAQALEDVLNLSAQESTFKVFVGMRHWFPYIQEAVNDILQEDFHQIPAICMTPYFSKMSTQAYFNQFDKAMRKFEEEGRILPRVVKIASWNSHPLFIQALAEKVESGIQHFPAVKENTGKVLFTAHSLPAAIIDQGDPYEQQLLETARLITGRVNLPAERWGFCYQSAGTQNTRWLGPSIEETLERFAQEGIKNVLVAPIGFVSDHVEILFDIDIEAKDLAQSAGIHLERTEALNTSSLFVEALAQIIKHGVHQ